MSSVVMAVAKAAGEGWMAEKEWRGSNAIREQHRV
jgi:hypothetical protein